jgi:protein phosphatase 2C
LYLHVGFDTVYDFFGVYDGHRGPHVARACEERFHGVMVEEVGGDDQGRDNDDQGVEYWGRVMEGCFGKMDEEVRGNGVGKMVGSTAVVAVVGEEEVVVANCGDSRAVMCSGGVALALSKDHKVRVLCTFSFYCFNFLKMENATKSNGLRLEIETGKR